MGTVTPIKDRMTKGDYEDQIRLHKFKKRTIIAAILLVVAIVIVVTIINENTKSYTKIKVTKEVSHKLNTEGGYMRYAGNFLLYSMDGANCTNASGKQLWNVTYQMQNPRAEVCGEYAALADYNGTSLYIMNLSGKQAEITTSMPIHDFSISANGYVAVFEENPSNMAIYVYSKNGETVAVFDITMEESGYPFDLAISKNGRLVAVDYLYVGLKGTSGMYESKVAFYNFGNVGANYTDNNVGGYYYNDELIGVLRYFDDTHCFALSDSRLLFYEGTQIPELKTTVSMTEEVQNYYYSEDYLALIFYDTETGGNRLELYSATGKKLNEIRFDMDYSEVAFFGNYLYIYNQSECTIYTSKGKKKYSGLFDRNTFLMIPKNKDKFVTLTKNYIESITLK